MLTCTHAFTFTVQIISCLQFCTLAKVLTFSEECESHVMSLFKKTARHLIHKFSRVSCPAVVGLGSGLGMLVVMKFKG